MFSSTTFQRGFTGLVTIEMLDYSELALTGRVIRRRRWPTVVTKEWTWSTTILRWEYCTDPSHHSHNQQLQVLRKSRTA